MFGASSYQRMTAVIFWFESDISSYDLFDIKLTLRSLSV
jgi:hypothetical protein